MRIKNKIILNFLNIWKLQKKVRKKQIILVLILSLFSSFFEVVTIGTLIPFIDIMIDPRAAIKYLDYPSFAYFDFININNYSDYDIKQFVAVVLIISTICSALFRFFLYYINIKIAYFSDYDLKSLIFEKINYTKLNFRKKLNINITLSNFEKIQSVFNTLSSCLFIICYSVFSTIIIVSLFYIDARITIVLCIFTLIYYTLVNIFTKKFIQSQSKKNSISTDEKFKILNYSFNYFKNIILDKIHKIYIESFKIAIYDWATSNVKIKCLLGLVGNFFVTLLFIIITIIILQLSAYESFGNNISKITAIAFGGQRIISSLNNIFNNYQKIIFLQQPLGDVLNFIKKILNSKKENNTKRKKVNIKDFQEIRLKNVNYKINKKILFKNINLTIKHKDKVLISGKTGSGKTSLVEIISGLNDNFQGDIILNERRMKKNKLEKIRDFFAIVPQDIFIFNASILENITNKQPNERIDQDRLKLAIKCAELEEFVKNQKNNLDYILALGGQNMSGGQKQRIGIARALYKDTPLIIFDEATNALDENTESKIYSNIKKLYNEKTFICISHNKKILRFFNKKINL